jgi:hypothetical protein
MKEITIEHGDTVIVPRPDQKFEEYRVDEVLMEEQEIVLVHKSKTEIDYEAGKEWAVSKKIDLGRFMDLLQNHRISLLKDPLEVLYTVAEEAE